MIALPVGKTIGVPQVSCARGVLGPILEPWLPLWIGSRRVLQQVESVVVSSGKWGLTRMCESRPCLIMLSAEHGKREGPCHTLRLLPCASSKMIACTFDDLLAKLFYNWYRLAVEM
ncbi:unnamed protein product [Strongylus vulgaris]|uniref:Uncharacterized protein n=1 Tax=Strongylus vulgaris TaxID=40348 RepID=A0A3P7IDS6_STRVU|nr:unnamed protein product [Strongylus vulgaris]